MASAVSPSRRKRKSSSSELDSGSSSKKIKDAEKSAKPSSSHSKKSKTKSKKDIKASLKTVSELAKLVTSGAVQVPKSLINYSSDKAVLLDQVFTILSPNDVSGMLPDILKGLKTKRVKSLCYEQLKRMSVEEINRVLQSDDNSPHTPEGVSSEMTSTASNQIQTQEEAVDVNKTIGESIETMAMETQVLESHSHKLDGSKEDETKGTVSEADEKDSLKDERGLLSSQRESRGITMQQTCKEEKNVEKQIRPKKDRDTSTKVYDTTKNESPLMKKKDVTANGLDTINLKASKSVKERKKSTESHRVCVEESIHKQIKAKEKADACTEIQKPTKQRKERERKSERSGEDVSSKDQTIIGSEKVVGHESSVEVEGNLEKHEHSSNVPLIEEEDASKVDNHTKEAEGGKGDTEGEDVDVLEVEVSELDAAQLLEMELRRRALESIARKFSDSSRTKNEKDQQKSEPNRSTSASEEDFPMVVYVSDSDMEELECGTRSGKGENPSPNIDMTVNCEESGSPVGAVGEDEDGTETMDVAELLEMKLREKALQSMITNRRKRHSTQ